MGGNAFQFWCKNSKHFVLDIALSDELVKSLSRESSPEKMECQNFDETPSWKHNKADQLTASQILGLDEKFEKKSNSSGSETRQNGQKG